MCVFSLFLVRLAWEPNAISVSHDDFSRGCLDALIHAILPHARQLSKRTPCSSPLPRDFFFEWQACHTSPIYPFQLLARRFAVATDFEPCQQESGLFGEPRPHGMRHIYLHLPFLLPSRYVSFCSLPAQITGLFSMIILDPLLVALSVLHDSITLVSASCQTSRCPQTPARFHEAVPPAFDMSTPVDCLGSVHRTALVALSLPTKKTLLCVDCTLSRRRRGNMSR